MRKVMAIIAVCTVLFTFIGCETAEETAIREQKEAQQKVALEQKARVDAERKQQEEADIKLKELFGDEIPCQVNTTGQSQFTSLVNMNISKMRTFIHRSNGTLTIMFNYDVNSPNIPVMQRFLVRVFDQNGQYITHFTTAEIFSLHKVSQQFKVIYKMIELKGTDNLLQYQINMRDAAFIAQAEFGYCEACRI